MIKYLMNKNASQLIQELDELSGGKLKKKEDLERIIDISLRKNKVKVLEEAAFTAKFLNGLLSVIQRGDSFIDENVFERYTKEYSGNLERLKSSIKEIISGEGNFLISIYEQKYFAISQEALNNLNELCSDLSWLKIYQNEQKKSR